MLLKAILFDLDGVITDTAAYHFKAWSWLAEKYQLQLEPDVETRLKGISRLDSLKIILQENDLPVGYAEEKMEKMCIEKNDYYKKLISMMTPQDILPGIEPFLKEARRADIRIGLASASQNGSYILDKIGLRSCFDTIVDPSLLIKGKPDPEIFIKCAHQLGVPLENCVGIEDAAAGVEAINAAGILSVGIGSDIELKAAQIILPLTQQLKLNIF